MDNIELDKHLFGPEDLFVEYGDLEFDDTRKPGPHKERYTSKRHIDGHLCAPIYGEEVDMLMDCSESDLICKRHKKIHQRIKDLNCISFRELPDPIESVYQWAKTVQLKAPVISNRRRIMKTAVENWIVQKCNLMAVAETIIPRERILKRCRSKLDEFFMKESTELFNDLQLTIKVEIIKDAICYKSIEEGEFLQFMDGLFERDLSIITICGRQVIFPTTLVICALDKAQAEYWLKCYWILTDIFRHYVGCSIFETGCDLLKKFKRLRSVGPKGFYSFMASWEPYIVGYTVNLPDDLGCDQLYKHQLSSMSKFLEQSGTGLTMSDFSPKSNARNHILMFLELTGMVKILGYPVLDGSKLLDQLRQYGTTPSEVRHEETMVSIIGVTRRDFILQHFEKTGRMPKFASYPDELKPYLEKNRKIPKRIAEDYKLWYQVKFAKNFEYNYSPDLTELAKDSACALPRSHWMKMYDKCAFKYRYGKRQPYAHKGLKPPKTRVIDALLCADEDHLKNLIDAREREEFDVEDHIIVQCGKELEQKESSGRAFTKQTADQRWVQASMESNIAEGPFRFVKEQSMTSGELVNLNRTMQDLINLGGGSELVNIDFVKWCLQHRVGNTYEIGEVLDELFGLRGLYKTSHHFFVNILTLCNNRLTPPDFDESGMPVEGEYCMKNFLGGCEGMHQKKWTWFTISAIKVALETTGIKATIMGQGDNQIVVLHYTKDQLEFRSTLRSSFLEALRTIFLNVNHQLKPEETWWSQFLHEYGKARVYKGVAVSSGTKKATKLIPDINDGLFSIHSSISTINTMTEALARGSSRPDIPFIMNQMLLSNYLARKHIISGEDHSSEPRLIRSLLLYPADFGGIPCSTYYGHTVRGHDDPVTIWLSIQQTLRELNPLLWAKVIDLWQIYPNQEITNTLSRLLEDPYCLNVKTLPSAEAEIRKLTTEYLKSDRVSNPSIKRLYNTDVSVGYDQLKSILATMNPMYAQIGHQILRYSNAGIGKMLQQKLTATKTIEQAAQYVKGTRISLIELIEKRNCDLVRELRKRLRTRTYNVVNRQFVSESDCPYTLSVKLRRTHWGKEFLELSKPPYMHQIRLIDRDEATEEQLKRSIIIKCSKDVSKNFGLPIEKMGPYKPYVGSVTREKITKPTLDVAQKTTYISALLQLGKLKSWLERLGRKNLVGLLDELIKEKTSMIDLPEETDVHDYFTTIRSGNMFHRLTTEVEHSNSMINAMPTIASHFLQSSNNLQSMTKDGEDYSIFFQMIYASNIMTINMMMEYLDIIPPEICAVLHCDACTHLLPEPTFDIAQYYFPAVQPPTREIIIEQEPSDDIDILMDLATGWAFGKNIDANYDLNHSSCKPDNTRPDVRKGQVSINDFRRCNLLNVLLVSFMSSGHCKQLLKETNDLLKEQYDDLSFTYLADVILESGKLEELFELFKHRGVREHSMVVRSDRLSTLISRNVQNLSLEYKDHFSRTLIPYTFREDLDTYEAFVPLKFYSELLRHARTRSKPLENFINLQNLWRAKRSVNIEHIIPSYAKDQVITVWRAASGVRRDKSINVIPPVFSIVEANYPLSDVLAYLNRRAEKDVDVNYNFLGFLARPCVVISSAINKYLEVLSVSGFLRSHKNKSGNLYSLAEGSAGTFATLMTILPNFNGFYNTLMDPEIDGRSCATDCYPPAARVLGLTSSPNRIVNYKLSTGETDISTSVFKDKLVENFRSYPPSLVTMDAESRLHGDNVEHINNLLGSCVAHGAEMIIFKVFFSQNLVATREKLASQFDSHYFFIMKPISSNPNSTELFFCALDRSCTSERLIERLDMLTQASLLAYLKKTDKIGESVLPFYVDKAKLVCDHIKSIVCPVPTFGDLIVGKDHCGLICVRRLEHSLLALDIINTSDGSDLTNIIIRSGLLNKLWRKILEIIFITRAMMSKSDDLPIILSSLSHYSIAEGNLPEFRLTGKSGLLELNLLRGDYLDKFENIKFFVRSWGKDEKCSCEATHRELDKDSGVGLSENLVKYLIGLRLANPRIKSRFFFRR